jgi:hypothetical protein
MRFAVGKNLYSISLFLSDELMLGWHSKLPVYIIFILTCKPNATMTTKSAGPLSLLPFDAWPSYYFFSEFDSILFSFVLFHVFLISSCIVQLGSMITCDSWCKGCLQTIAVCSLRLSGSWKLWLLMDDAVKFLSTYTFGFQRWLPSAQGMQCLATFMDDGIVAFRIIDDNLAVLLWHCSDVNFILTVFCMYHNWFVCGMSYKWF